jgi:hypothetical protein
MNAKEGFLMKRVLFFLSATILVGSAAFGLVWALQSNQAGPAPFTATIKETRYGPEGQVAYTEFHLFAKRSDGSHVLVMRRQDPAEAWIEVRRITDVSARRTIVVDPATESITTYPLTESVVNEYSAPTHNCGGSLDEARAGVTGHQVIPLRREFALSGRKTAFNEQWVAPALGCFPIWNSLTVKVDGKVVGTVVRETLFLAEAEPASSHFEVPSGFAERTPSEVLAEFERRFPGRHAASVEAGRRLDAAYLAHQGNP